MNNQESIEEVGGFENGGELTGGIEKMPKKKKAGSGGSPETESERVIDSAEWRKLKLKEYEGTITEEDFEKLLMFEFREVLREIEPIEKDFDPESEVGEILKLPSPERKQALADFYDKFGRQRKALAKCRVFIERFIMLNPGVDKEKLMRIVKKFGRRYGFTNEQESAAAKILDSYYEHRHNALEMIDKYPDKAAVVNALTGLNFKDGSKFKISTGPMSIDIETDGVSAQRIESRSDRKRKKFPAGGFADSSGEPPGRVMFTVLNSDRDKRFMSKGGLLIHEIEHVKNKLLRSFFEYQPDEEDIIGCETAYDDYVSKNITDRAEEILPVLFSLVRDLSLSQARDEIIAMKKGGDLPTPDVFFEKRGGPYDYAAEYRDKKQYKKDLCYQKMSKKMLVDEYEKIIKDALAAFDRLAQKYNRNEVIAMLMDKPLTEWPKLEERMRSA